MPRQETLKSLRAKGFDKSTYVFGAMKMFAVSCSQCQALVINGVPTHEARCPNARKAKAELAEDDE